MSVQGAASPQAPCDLMPGDSAAMAEAEEGLRGVRERFDHSDDPASKAELAAEALRYVEQQLAFTRERRRKLDEAEGRLWARRNRLERYLIDARGASWWRKRRSEAANG